MPFLSRRSHVPARPFLIVALMLAALLPGCGSNPEMALVDPGKYQFYDCAQLARDKKRLSEHAEELRALQQKAARDPSGAFIARVSYEPDYLSTVGNLRLIEAKAQEKNCTPTASGDLKPPPR